MAASLAEWTTDQVVAFAESLELTELAPVFRRRKIVGRDLIVANSDSLAEAGVTRQSERDVLYPALEPLIDALPREVRQEALKEQLTNVVAYQATRLAAEEEAEKGKAEETKEEVVLDENDERPNLKLSEMSEEQLRQQLGDLGTRTLTDAERAELEKRKQDPLTAAELARLDAMLEGRYVAETGTITKRTILTETGEEYKNIDEEKFGEGVAQVNDLFASAFADLDGL